MVWICNGCGAGNISESQYCIKCNSPRPTVESMNCWDFLHCDDDFKQKCIVYKTDMGGGCWKFHNVLRGFQGNNNQPCRNCDCYRKLTG